MTALTQSMLLYKNNTQKELKMANYHQTGLHTLQELAKEKQKEKTMSDLATEARIELLKREQSPEEVCKEDRECTSRWIDAFGDCA